MRYLLMPLRWLYCLYAALTFIAVMLVLFPFGIIASFFGSIRGGNLMFGICTVWADVWFFLAGIYHRNIYEQPVNKKKQYIFVANHISYLDAAIIFKAIRQPARPLGKIEMSRLPVFGFIYRKAIVTVDRSSAENRAKSVRRLKAVLRSGISIFFFPEGTFNTTAQPLKEFYDGAFRIAIETQTPIKPVLFLDSYNRMHYRHPFTLNAGVCRAVHLEEIEVAGLTAADMPALKQKVFYMMEKKLQEYKAAWITSAPVLHRG